GMTFFTALPAFLAPSTVLSPTFLAPSTVLSPTFLLTSTVFAPTDLALSPTSSALSATSLPALFASPGTSSALSATKFAARATASPVASSTFSVVVTSRSSPLREVTLTVLLPSRVVTTTLDMRGLFRNVLVSVLVPLASTEVVISELSGASTVVGLAVAVASVALYWLQPAASATSKSIVIKKIFFVTLLSS